MKNILYENIKIFHYGGNLLSNFYEIELSRNWHWMWSFFIIIKNILIIFMLYY